MPHKLCEKCGHDEYWHTFDGCWNSDHEWGYFKGKKELLEKFSGRLDFMDNYSDMPKEDIISGYKWLLWLREEVTNEIKIRMKEKEGE
jgi:hypothetical protein